jgi:hypothetical protein
MEYGNRKVRALRQSLSTLILIGILYVGGIAFGLQLDATVFSALSVAVGVVTGSFNWANSSEHRK